MAGGSLTGFFWLTQRAIAEMATRYGSHVVSVLAACGIRVNAISPGRAGQVSDVVDGVLLLESPLGITGKILRIDGTPNGQATSRETAG